MAIFRVDAVGDSIPTYGGRTVKSGRPFVLRQSQYVEKARANPAFEELTILQAGAVLWRRVTTLFR